MKYKDIKLKLEEQLEKNMEINLQTQEYKKQSEKLADSFREIIMRNSEKIKKLMANKNSKLVKKFLEIGEKQGKIIKMGKQQFREFLEYFWDQNIFIKEKYLSCFIFGQIIWWQQKLILVKDLELITKVIASKSCSNKEELENSKEIMDFQNYIQRLRFYNQRVRKGWEKNIYSKMCQNRKNQELLVNQSGRICIQGCLFIKKMLKISHDFVNLDALNIKAWENYYKNLNKKSVQQKMESQYQGDEFKSCLNLKNVSKKSSSMKKIQEFYQERGNNILSTIISVCESLEEEQEQVENQLQNNNQFNNEFQLCYQNNEICKNYDENMFDIEKNSQTKQENSQSEVNIKSNTNEIFLFDEQKIERSESFEDLVNNQNQNYNEDDIQNQIDDISNIAKNNPLKLQKNNYKNQQQNHRIKQKQLTETYQQYQNQEKKQNDLQLQDQILNLSQQENIHGYSGNKQSISFQNTQKKKQINQNPSIYKKKIEDKKLEKLYYQSDFTDIIEDTENNISLNYFVPKKQYSQIGLEIKGQNQIKIQNKQYSDQQIQQKPNQTQQKKFNQNQDQNISIISFLTLNNESQTDINMKEIQQQQNNRSNLKDKNNDSNNFHINQYKRNNQTNFIIINNNKLNNFGSKISIQQEFSPLGNSNLKTYMSENDLSNNSGNSYNNINLSLNNLNINTNYAGNNNNNVNNFNNNKQQNNNFNISNYNINKNQNSITNINSLAIFSRSSLNNPVSTFNNICGDCDELSFNETSFEEISMV